MTQPTYFTVVGDFKSIVADSVGDPDYDPDFGVLAATVTFAPLLKRGTIIRATKADPRPTGFLASPITGFIDVDGRLKLRSAKDPLSGKGTGNKSAYDYAPVRLLADTQLLELDGPLFYSVTFSDVVYNGEERAIKGFTFQAPTVDVELNLISLLGTAVRASAASPVGGNSIAVLPTSVRVTKGGELIFSVQGQDIPGPIDVKKFTVAGPVGPEGPAGPEGPVGPPGPMALDVKLTTPAAGDVMMYYAVGSEWVNTPGYSRPQIDALLAVMRSRQGAQRLGGLADVTVPSPAVDDFLVFNGSGWVSTGGYTRSQVDSRLSGLASGLARKPAVQSVLAYPPASPNVGESYIVAVSANDVWAGHDNEIVFWDGSQWVFSNPAQGDTHAVLAANNSVTWNGTAWVVIGSQASDLGQLQDVLLTTPGTGEVLLFDGTEWVNAKVPSGWLKELLDVELTANLKDKDVLSYDGTSGKWVGVDPPASSLDGLTDVYTATVKDGDILSFDAAIGQWASKAPQAVTAPLSALTDVDAKSPQVGDLLAYNGVHWANAAQRQQSLDGLSDVDISAATAGEGLIFDGVKWSAGVVSSQSGGVSRVVVAADDLLFTPPADPNTDYVVVLPANMKSAPSVAALHFDGADGSQTINDSSEIAQDWVASAGASLSNRESKFGGSSLKLESNSKQHINADGNPDHYAFGFDDFTVEMWIFPLHPQYTQVLYDSRPFGYEGAYPSIWLQGGHVVYYVDGATVLTTAPVTANTWHHVALVRDGSYTKLYLDGVPAPLDFPDTLDYLNAPDRPQISGSGSNASGYFDGYIDDVRITKGHAQYQRAFTPPVRRHVAVNNPAVLMPPAAGHTNRYTVINESPTPLMVAAPHGESIDGFREVVIEDLDTIDVVSDGKNWHTIDADRPSASPTVLTVEERIVAAARKNVLVDGDLLGIVDTSDNDNLKQVSFADLKGSLPDTYTSAEIDSRIDALTTGLSHSVSVLTITNTPPAAPAIESFYIVGTNPSGAWAGHANEVAGWDGSQWLFSAPRSGETHLVEDVVENWHWNGNGWVKIANAGTAPAAAVSDVWMVGDVKQSVLDEAQFRLALPASERNKWVLADGRNVAGTAFSTLTGRNNVPDLRGTYLRGYGNNGVKSGWSGGDLNQYFDDHTRMPRNAFSFSVSSNGNHHHDMYITDTAAPGATVYAIENSGAQVDNAYPVSGNNIWKQWGGTRRGQKNNLLVDAGNHAHTVSINGGGDSVTQPRSYSVAFYIKVD